jgi:phospholipid/cholesterol/gamma-HCH transport system permease protein
MSGVGVGAVLGPLGRLALDTSRGVGGVVLLAGQAAASCVQGRVPWREVLRQVHGCAVGSLAITVLAGVCLGAIVGAQGMGYVQRFNAPAVYGWAAYFAACREVGPLLVGLVLSARLGAHHAAELAALRVTDRVDGLAALGVDPVLVLAVPRLLAMPLAFGVLMLWADAVSLLSATGFAWAFGLSPAVCWASILDHALLADLVLGLQKAVAYGAVSGLVSVALGLRAQGGADGVGVAVTRAAVASLLTIAVTHQVLTVVTTG